MRRQLLLSAAALTFALVLAAPLAGAAHTDGGTHFEGASDGVDADGNTGAAEDGDGDAVYGTVQGALDAADAGDTVLVAPGVHHVQDAPAVVRTDVTLAGNATLPSILVADSSDLARDANQLGTLSVQASATVRDLHVVRRVTDMSAEGGQDKHTKALGITRDADGGPVTATVEDVRVRLTDLTGADDKGDALWVSNFNALGGERYALDVTLEDVTASNHGATGTFGAALAVVAVDKPIDVAVEDSRLGDSDKGLYLATFAGGSIDAAVTGNTFVGNRLQVRDAAGTLDIKSVLGSNTFHRGAAVAGPAGDDFQNTIWSSAQSALDAAEAGGTVLLASGTYQERLTGFPAGVTVRGFAAPARAVVVDPPSNTPAFDIRSEEVTVDGITIVGRNSRVKGVTGVTIRDSRIVGQPHGLNIAGAQVTIVDNRFVPGTPGVGNALQIKGALSDGSVIADNRVTGFSNGPIVNGVQDLTIRGNNFHEMEQFGVLLVSKGRAVEDTRIVDNTFRDSRWGVILRERPGQGTPAEVTGSEIHFNAFFGVEGAVLGLNGTTTLGPAETVDATHNFWGTPAGPAPVPAGLALALANGQASQAPDELPGPVSGVGGNVQYAPWCAHFTCPANHAVHDASPVHAGPPAS